MTPDPPIDPDALVRVPDVVGLGWDVARTVGHEAGLWTTAPDPDGMPLSALGWPGGVVVRQDPPPGALARWRSALTVWVERGGEAGDREPRRPLPPVAAFFADPHDNEENL